MRSYGANPLARYNIKSLVEKNTDGFPELSYALEVSLESSGWSRLKNVQFYDEEGKLIGSLKKPQMALPGNNRNEKEKSLF